MGTDVLYVSQREWFIDSARSVLAWLPPEGVAIFFQSDIRVGGTWIDKGYLIMRAIEAEGAEKEMSVRRRAGGIH